MLSFFTMTSHQCRVASFTKGVKPRLAERPLKIYGHLANRGLTSLVKEATGILNYDSIIFFLQLVRANDRENVTKICKDNLIVIMGFPHKWPVIRRLYAMTSSWYTCIRCHRNENQTHVRYISWYIWIFFTSTFSSYAGIPWNIIGLRIPDSKFHGAHMGSTWVLSAPDGPYVGPINLALRDTMLWSHQLEDGALLPRPLPSMAFVGLKSMAPI